MDPLLLILFLILFYFLYLAQRGREASRRIGEENTAAVRENTAAVREQTEILRQQMIQKASEIK